MGKTQSTKRRSCIGKQTTLVTYSLRDFGSYTVGGRTHKVADGEPREVFFTESASYQYDPRGHFSVEHAYVQYFIPENRNSHPPVVLVHGGGMHGSTWETTPDGRPGWINLLLAQGYEVHVLDNVERGRSGFAPGLWQDDPILRSQEEAWLLFRIGAKKNFTDKQPFKGSLFPVDSFENFAQKIVPRWLTTTHLHVAALIDTLRHTGPAIVICHSQGGEIALNAAAAVPEYFAGLIAVEPSASPKSVETTPQVPCVLFAGDFLDAEQHWCRRLEQWLEWSTFACDNLQLIQSGKDCASGHTHFPMLDHGSEEVLRLCMRTFEACFLAAR